MQYGLESKEDIFSKVIYNTLMMTIHPAGKAVTAYVCSGLILLACFVCGSSWCEASQGGAFIRAPDFELVDMNGMNHSIADYRGKVILINFWATWCKPCTTEMPSLNSLYNAYKKRGFEVVAVSTDRNASSVRKFLGREKGIDFLVLLDPGSETMRQYGVFSLPTTFLINTSGMIVEKFMGEQQWMGPEIQMKIEKVLDYGKEQ